MARRQMDAFDLEAERQADALKAMGRMVGGFKPTHKRTPKMAVATVAARDRAAMHVGFAKDRVDG